MPVGARGRPAKSEKWKRQGNKYWEVEIIPKVSDFIELRCPICDYNNQPVISRFEPVHRHVSGWFVSSPEYWVTDWAAQPVRISLECHYLAYGGTNYARFAQLVNAQQWCVATITRAGQRTKQQVNKNIINKEENDEDISASENDEAKRREWISKLKWKTKWLREGEKCSNRHSVNVFRWSGMLENDKWSAELGTRTPTRIFWWRYSLLSCEEQQQRYVATFHGTSKSYVCKWHSKCLSTAKITVHGANKADKIRTRGSERKKRQVSEVHTVDDDLFSDSFQLICNYYFR